MHNNNKNIITAVYLHIIGISQFAGKVPRLCVCFVGYTIEKKGTRRSSDFDYNRIIRLRLVPPENCGNMHIGIVFLAETRDILSRSRARFSHKSH